MTYDRLASPPPLRARIATATLLVLALALLTALAAPPAHAAARGTGFGTWAPLSAEGWHGSMLIDGVHTYCILPGLPAPTGDSVDHGVRADGGGLSPQQLAGINLLVTEYGQTDDPVQAAAVGWAVKALSNRQEALGGWGYRGDSLAEAVRWSLQRTAPEHAQAVAQRAEQYYAEGAAAAVTPSMTLTLATDPADPGRGVVRVNGPEGAHGSLSLQNAVFSDTGAADRSGVVPGVEYAITAAPEVLDGMPYRVSATGRFTVGPAPAVRYFTTPGQQDTAGPGGPAELTVEGADAEPRPATFAPVITTQVTAPEAEGGAFIDDVTIGPREGAAWPRDAQGGFVAVRATAVVYRTETAPARGADVPAEAVPVGELELVTDTARGGGTYRVSSDWELPGPGTYTAVWEVSAEAQHPEVARHIAAGYHWSEQFGIPSQIVHVPEPPAPAPSATPSSAPPREEEPADELAVTGASGDKARLGGAGLAALLLGGALLAHLSQRQRAGG